MSARLEDSRIDRTQRALSLLVVEAHEEVAWVVRAIFERNGHAVTVATTPGAARSLMDGLAPDQLVVDFVLAVGDGLAHARQVRGERDIEVVLMSGGLGELPGSGDLQLQQKPFTPDRFEDSLHRCLADLAASRAAQGKHSRL